MKYDENAPVAEALERWLDGHNLRRVSRLTGIIRSMLYDYMAGKIPIPAWVLTRIYTALPDIQRLAECIGAADLGLSQHALPAANVPGTVSRAAMRVGVRAGQVESVVLTATADGVVTEKEGAAFARTVDELEREAETLRAAAKRGQS